MGETLISDPVTKAVPIVPAPKPMTVRRYTYDEVSAEFPETNQPCELCNGELIFMASPSFYHQEISFRFQIALHEWVNARELGKVIASPIDMILSPHQVRQPDVAFIARERLHIIGRVINGPVDLAVEVISLDTGGRQRDRFDKRDLYEQYGVKEYWMIDPEARTVEVLFLQTGTYMLHGRFGPGVSAQSRLLDGFAVSVDILLAESPL
jgi:Uma2 family endonuclease